MGDAYTYGMDEHEAPPKPPRKSPLRALGVLLLLGAAAYALVFAPWAPFAQVGDEIKDGVSDVADSLGTGDASGTPDDIQARWDAEFGAGDDAEATAGRTALWLFRNDMRGLRNAVRRDEDEKIRTWRASIEKHFAEARAWREKHGPESVSNESR